ncbi:FixH family protein [Maricaulis sp.]|jgi:nitrogen fixation protein FixH|uniref:FixH family protein n=1 Tax=Maricaulis sp. TaxID=1486257 RepID=UPI0025EE2A82|nr:FixH family protein [Maricaulis sp.]MDF1767488.1 FixH family protein [Maricaulis sp.]
MRNPFNPLRGWHVLILILAFFGVTIGVNATFITLALRTHPGEDVPRSYVQGLNYNDTLDRRRAQEALGWTARVNLVERDVVLAISAADGSPVAGLDLVGTLIHPADTSRDCPLAFAESRPGVYRVTLPCDGQGDWRLEAHSRDDAPFEMVSELWLP